MRLWLALLTLALAQSQPPGELALVAVDPYGRPVDATWTLEGGKEILKKQAMGSLQVAPGPYRLAVTAEGFFGTTVEVDVRSGERSEVQAMLDASLVTLTERAIVIHDVIHFETDKAVILPESFDLLRQVARVIIEHPELLLISVEGHADSRGDDAYNLDLSARRAKAVETFLIGQAVSPTRLRSQGFGEARPIVAEETEEAWAKNRRVEFIVVKRADIPTQ